MTGVEMGDGGPNSSTLDKPPTKAQLTELANMHLVNTQVWAVVAGLPLAFNALTVTRIVVDGSAEPFLVFSLFVGFLTSGCFGATALRSVIKSIHYKIEAQFSA